jgi:hypothetical protein
LPIPDFDVDKQRGNQASGSNAGDLLAFVVSYSDRYGV